MLCLTTYMERNSILLDVRHSNVTKSYNHSFIIPASLRMRTKTLKENHISERQVSCGPQSNH